MHTGANTPLWCAVLVDCCAEFVDSAGRKPRSPGRSQGAGREASGVVSSGSVCALQWADGTVTALIGSLQCGRVLSGLVSAPSRSVRVGSGQRNVLQLKLALPPPNRRRGDVGQSHLAFRSSPPPVSLPPDRRVGSPPNYRAKTVCV